MNHFLRASAALFALGNAASAIAGSPAPQTQTKCNQCEPSAEFRAKIGIALPERAIIYDFGNGPFWQNSYLLVVDLDRSEAFTYRFPPDEGGPTKLELRGKLALTAEQLTSLNALAKPIWNPPPLKHSRGESIELRTDTFQTVYVVDGPVMAKALEMGSGPAWFTELVNALGTLAK